MTAALPAARGSGMFGPMRSLLALALVVAAAVACRPSATLERTTPVGNLQIYRSVLVRVGGPAAGGGNAESLEAMVAAELRNRCAMEVHLASRGASESDLQLDLTIQNAGRGGGGLIQNPNMATMDVLMVLSDAIDGELVGSALVRGKSSAVMVEGGESPEQQALGVVGKTIGEVLGKSGCAGERIARPTPTPAEGDAGVVASSDGDAGPVGPDEAKRAEAEAANEAGKDKFRSGDPAAALDDFRTALGLVRDARYAINICLAHEALQQWDAAEKACNDVLGMQPTESVAAKARQRLDIIAERRKG